MTLPSDRRSARERSRPAVRLVVGCGYLGERVARRWLAAGDRVLAVTRREDRGRELIQLGIEPLVADVTSAVWPRPEALAQVDTVLWAVGFDRQAGVTHRDVHVLGLGRLLDALPEGCRVILSSSTGVWSDEAGGRVAEDTPVNPSREAGRVLVEAERMLREHPRGPGVALRFAGLYGPGRWPRLDDLRAGRPIAAAPESWLNLIHVDDAASVVVAVADAEAPRPLYVVSDGHPVRRRAWYGRLAEVIGAPAPQWASPGDDSQARGRRADKRVDPALVYADLGLLPRHPDALEAIRLQLPES
jgi:nucleoside-diphosphate-sugar epimerase